MANPLLALQVQPPNIDVAGSLSRGQELRTVSLNNALRAYQMQKLQQEDEKANALAAFNKQHGAGLVQGNEESINALAALDPTAALNYRKENLGIQETKGKINKADFDIAMGRAEYAANSMQALLQAPAAARPLLYERMKHSAQEQGSGIKLPDQLPGYDDNTLRTLAGQAVAVKDQIAAQSQAGADAETARHNRAQEGLTARGQNMADRRARDAQANAGKPSLSPGYRWKADGSGAQEIIPGGPADTTGMRGKATDAQRVTALYADRARLSDKILTGSGKEGEEGYVPPADIWGTSLGEVSASKIPGVGNFLVSEAFQKYDQAKRDFINAVLRKESGAVISEEEFDNANKQYFPQPGDAEAVIKQKRANRAVAINGLRRAAGSAIETQDSGVIDFNDLPDD